MNGDLRLFANQIHSCVEIFELFALGFDHVSTYLNLPGDAGTWADWVKAENEASTRFAKPIKQADGAIPAELRPFLNTPGDEGLLVKQPFLMRLYGVLSAIDSAAASLNYHRGYENPKEWRKTRRALDRDAWLAGRPRGVVLKPASRFPMDDGAWWKRAIAVGRIEEKKTRGEHWHTQFSNLCRVPEIANCEIDYFAISEILDIECSSWSTLRIGMVPLIERMEVRSDHAAFIPGPLRLATNGANNLIIENGREGDCSEMCDRAETALRYLAMRQVQVVLFPEAVVPDTVVQRIQQVLSELHRDGSECPILTLAGTFTRKDDGTDGSPGYNQAIVLNARGDELFRQRKMHPYRMEGYEQGFYGLQHIYGNKPAKEDILLQPRRMVFCDSRATGYRVAVAICEDSAQDDPCLRALRAMRPNLVLIPVMAGALEQTRGFVGTVQGLSVDPGCLSVVVNSAALPRAEWAIRAAAGKAPPEDPPLGVVGLPGLMDLAGSGHVPFHLLKEVTDAGGVEVLIYECP